MKKIVELFIIPEFKKVHLTKDVGLVPYYLSKIYNLEAEIVYTNRVKEELPQKFRGIRLTELPYKKVNNFLNKIDKFKILENWNFLKYLFKNLKNIDILFLFHFNKKKVPIVFLYKFLNKNGKIYLKMDIDSKNTNNKLSKFSTKRVWTNLIYKKLDLISCESLESYYNIKRIGYHKVDISSKLLYISNGFDNEDYSEKIAFEEKENIMITVGRLGTYQKNTEMLLQSLEKLDLKNWKILLIGPYDKNFKNKYMEFLKRNNDKKDKIILVGNINNREKLYEIYKKSKVLILTSRREGFPLVYPEALRFGNYIITTKVSGAEDITNYNKIGKIIEIEDSNALNNELVKVIGGQIDLKKKYELSIEWSKKNFIWERILKNSEIRKRLFD